MKLPACRKEINYLLGKKLTSQVLAVPADVKDYIDQNLTEKCTTLLNF